MFRILLLLLLFPVVVVGSQPDSKTSWMINVGVGSSYMPLWSDVFDEQSEYKALKKLKSGVNLNPTAFYKFSPHGGAGLHYSMLASRFTDNYQEMINSTYPVYATMTRDERVYVNYIGASLMFMQRFSSQPRLQLMEYISAGPLFYRSESRSSLKIPNPDGFLNLNQNLLIEGVSYGISMNISAFYTIAPSIKLGVGMEALYGTVKSIDFISYETKFGTTDMENLLLNNPLKLSRIAGSIIVNYSF
jgi:hypothetical protein